MQNSIKKDLIFQLLESLGLGLSIWGIRKYFTQTSELNTLIDFVSKSSIFSPGILKRMLKTGKPKLYFESIRNMKESDDSISGIAFVQGVVDSSKYIKSALDPNMKLVLSSLKKNQIFSNRALNAKEKMHHRFINEFQLVDLDKESKVTIVNSMSVEHNEALSFIGSKTNIRRMSKVENVLSWFIYLVKTLQSLTTYGRNMPGIKLGDKFKEKGILIGQYVVALGEFVWDKTTDEIRMERPLYLQRDKAQLLQNLLDKKIGLQRNLALNSIMLGIFGFQFIRRSIKFFYNIKSKLQEYKDEQRYKKLDEIGEILTDDFKCIICMEKPKNIILKPCMHMAMCRECLKRLQTGVCPICKETITDVVKIFIA